MRTAYIPVRVARVNEGGPVMVCGRVHALRELVNELLRAREARRGSILERYREVDPSIIWMRIVGDLYVRRRVVSAASTSTKDAPKPTEG